MATIQDVKDHPVIKKVLADSFGGVMYNAANGGTYDSADVLQLWDSLPPGEQGAAGGIITGAIGFLKDYPGPR